MLPIFPRMLRFLPLTAFLLTACTLNQPIKNGPATNAPQWKNNQERLEKITQFQTRGAFAYLAEDQKVYARFNWQQTAHDRYRLLLTNPLGNTELQLDVQGSVVQLVDNKGQRYTNSNAEKMLTALTGMDIPLENLRQWMLGLPGSANDYTLDTEYRLQKLTYSQSGKVWNVTWSGYDTKHSPVLPSSIELQQGEQRIKLKMDNWTVQ